MKLSEVTVVTLIHVELVGAAKFQVKDPSNVDHDFWIHAGNWHPILDGAEIEKILWNTDLGRLI